MPAHDPTNSKDERDPLADKRVPPANTPLTDALLPRNPADPGLQGETVIHEVGANASRAELPGPASFPLGYEVIRELGRGGMGVVYLARQVKANRFVALKMILAGAHADASDLARFRTEAESIARLSHPNIVQVFEVGEHQGLPFFSLEYCASGSLAAKLNGTPQVAREAARLVEVMARAMQVAHEHQVIHRDLKPANVLLLADGTPKITDFGLAKKLDDVGQTRSGAIMGTPSYMAPEQADERSKHIGPACDVYALGAVLYECLTGRPPFKAATLMDTLIQVLKEEPVPPSSLTAKVPRDLETICLKCLRKEAPRRYESAVELAEDLRRFQAGEPILARPVGRLERGWRWCRRNRTVASLLLLVFLTLALGATVAGIFAVRTEQARQNALEERDEKEEERKRAERTLYFNRITLAQREWEAGNVQQARDHLDATPVKMRHWEYAHLYALAYNPEQTFLGHTSGVTSVAFSPDGKRIASGSSEVKVWDAQTGQEVLSIKGAFGPVGFSPNGKHIASASPGHTVKVWDAQTGKEVLMLKGHAHNVSSLAFSPDGTRIISGSHDKAVKVWDVQTGKETLSLQGHKAVVRSVAFSPDGKRIASGSQDQTVKMWEAQTGRQAHSIEGHTGPVNCLAFSPDGKRIVSGSGGDDGQGKFRLAEVKVWDAQTGQEALTLKGLTHFVNSVAFSSDGRRIATGIFGGALKVWDALTGQEVLSLKGHTHSVDSVAFSPDGQRIVSGSFDHTVKVWDAATGQGALTLKGHTSEVNSVAFSPDGKRIASGSSDATVKVWEVQTGQEVLSINGAYGFVAFSPDGQRLVSGNDDGAVKVRDAQTGREVLALKGYTGEVSSVAFSPNGQRIALGGSPDHTVKVWNAQTGQNVLTLKGHTGRVWSVAFSPDGKRIVSGSFAEIASGSFAETVKVWDAQTGQEVLKLKGHTGFVKRVVFSPDGKRIASGQFDQPGVVKVWDAKTGQETLTLEGHSNAVTSVAFSPDGQRIVSGSADKTVKVWDAQTGQEVLSLKGHAAAVTSVAFSPDGQGIASGSADRTVKVWEAQAGQEVLSFKGHKSFVYSAALSPDGKRIVSSEGRNEEIVWDVATGKPLPNEKPFHGGRDRQRSSDGSLLVLVDSPVVRLYKFSGSLQAARSARLRRLALPDPTWHEEQLHLAETANDPFAAAFHFQRLVTHHPWNAYLHVFRAHQLIRLGRRDEAALQFLQAITLDPATRLWPVDPRAPELGLEAAKKGDWPRAAAWFELAVHLPEPMEQASRISLLYAQLAAGRSEAACQVWRDLVRTTKESDDRAVSQLVSLGQWLPLTGPDALRLVKLAEGRVANQRDASSLHRLGAALYRAGRSEEAVRTLMESIKVQGKGGFVDTKPFLLLAWHQRGQHEAARKLFDRFEDWYKKQTFTDWQAKVRWKRLYDEAKALIRNMPRVTD